MKWWNNQILLGICTVVGGIAAIGYFSEKIAAILPSRLSQVVPVGLVWWDVLFGVLIVIIPYIFVHYLLIKSRKEIEEETKSKVPLGAFAEYYTSGSRHWQIGLAGFFVRLRGQVMIIILTSILLCYLKWIWPVLNSLHATFTLNISTSHLITYVLPILISLYLIKSTIRRFQFVKDTEKESLIRELSNIFSCDISANDRKKISFEKLCDKACDIVSSFFRISINESSVHCAIRVAYSKGNEGVSYKPMGKSQYFRTMNSNSKSISANEGIPFYFLNHAIDKQGVLIIKNISQAAVHGIIPKAEGENHWRVFNVASLMVSPLVWWKNNEKMIIGFIYLISGKDIFNVHHVDNLIRISESIAPNLNRIAEQSLPADARTSRG